MGFVNLKELGKIVDKANTPATKREPTPWLKLSDGQSIKIRFVNELDESSPSYDESRGLPIVEYEHKNPHNWKSKCVCTMESEGKCYGCEQNEQGKKGWWRKEQFYINVLVGEDTPSREVKVWSMGVRRNPVFDMIFEYFQDEGSITNRQWRLKRNGTGTDTTYALIPASADAIDFDWTGIDIPNLEDALYKIPYERQARWFGPGGEEEAPPADASDNIPW